VAENHLFLRGSAEDYLDNDRRENLPSLDEIVLRDELTRMGAQVDDDECWWITPTVTWSVYLERNGAGEVISAGGDLYPEADYLWADLQTVMTGMKGLSDHLGARLWVMGGDPEESRELDEAGLRAWLKLWAEKHFAV
jgi:hypothetical protein